MYSNYSDKKRRQFKTWGQSVCVRIGGLLTFLLAASNALLQERLAVEGGQGGGRVLLHPWVGLGQGVHGTRCRPVGHGGSQASIQGPHTWKMKCSSKVWVYSYQQCLDELFELLGSFWEDTLPLTLPVRALRLLRPTEVPVRLCRVPRDAKVFIAAPALDTAVEQAAEKQLKGWAGYHRGNLHTFKTPQITPKRLAFLTQIVMVMRGWHSSQRAVKNRSLNKQRSLAQQQYPKLRQMEPMYIYTDESGMGRSLNCITRWLTPMK